MASAGWERRNAHARTLGYRNYYDYRAHDYGRSPAKLAGEALRTARGHSGPADLERLIRSGRVATMFQEPVKDKDGKLREARVTVQLSDGTQRRFRLRGKQLDADQLRGLQAAVSDAGTDIYQNPSIDVLSLSEPDEHDLEDYDDFDPDELELDGDEDIPF